MYWRHEVSREWLEARRKCLTASDVVKLLPAYKRWKKQKDAYDEWVAAGKPKKKVEPVEPKRFLHEAVGIYAEKITEEPVDTQAPSSTAARGHIMEPYALEDVKFLGEKIYHWDDCQIVNHELSSILPISFSPDGLNREQLKDDIELEYKDLHLIGPKTLIKTPTKLVEVKSYKPYKHMKKIFEDPMEHEELWQIVFAMFVCPTIDHAALCLFNPSMPKGSKEFHIYERSKLGEQLAIIKDIYWLCIDTIKAIDSELASGPNSISETEIYNKWQQNYNKEHDIIHG